jgi:hypothetical protein
MTVVAFVLFLGLAVALSLVESKDQPIDTTQAQPGILSTDTTPNSTGITPTSDQQTGNVTNSGDSDQPTGTTDSEPDHPTGDN